MCVYLSAGFGYPFGFRVSVWVSGICGFGFGDGFPPESVFGSSSGFDFGFRFWVHGDFTRSEPDLLPSLPVNHGRRLEEAMGGDGPCPSCLPLSSGKQGDEISWMSEMMF
jgi:hypothetical protein